MIDKENNRDEKSKVWLREDGIVYVVVGKTVSEEEVMDLIDKIEEILKSVPGKAKVLVDVGTVAVIRSSSFRNKLAKRLRDTVESRGVEKAAFFGQKLITRTIVSFIVMASGLKNLKVFENKEKALKWLREENTK